MDLESINEKRATTTRYLDTICNIYQQNKPIIDNNNYDNYTFNFYQIDPCCGGPSYVNVKNGNLNVEFHLETSSYIFKNEEKFLNDFSNYVSFETYMDNLIKSSKLIHLDGEYSYLQEIDYSKIDTEKYQFMPSCGIFKFYSNENDKVVYTSYSIPDAYMHSNKSYISKIKIQDKDFHFNNLTLKNNTNTIINKYLNLGFKQFNNDQTNNTNHQIFYLIKDGLLISLETNEYENISITFSVESTNFFNISY